jgi:hypothetical protein
MNYEKPPKFIRVAIDHKTNSKVDYRMKRTIPLATDFHYFAASSWNLLESSNNFTDLRIKQLIDLSAELYNPIKKGRGPYWVITDSTGAVVKDWKTELSP